MSRLGLQIDKAQLADLYASLDGITSRKAIAAAINRTLTTGRARVARKIGEEITLGVSEIKKVIDTQRADSGVKGAGTVVRGANLYGAFVLTQKPVKLEKYKFTFRPTPKNAERLRKRNPNSKKLQTGITVTVRRGKPGDRLPESFLIGGRIFRRAHASDPAISLSALAGDNKIGPSGRVHRLPIKRRMGPSPMRIVENAPGVADGILADLGPVLEKNLASQMDRFLRPRAPRE